MPKQQINCRFVNVFELIDNAPVRIPWMVMRGEKPGPSVVLNAAIHGEEVVGTAVIHRIFREVRLVRGTLYAIPAANMQGLSQGFRFVPLGETTKWGNLNREFPGDPSGDPAERIAWAIYHKISSIRPAPTVVVDLHADAPESLAYILLDRFIRRANKSLASRTKALAENFGITVCNDDTLKEYSADDGERTLTGALYNFAHIPAFVAELGGPNVVYKKFEDLGVMGVKNILNALGMLKNFWEPRVDESKITTKYILRTYALAAGERSGFASYEVKLGDEVLKGERIATIADIFGKVKRVVRSPRHGFVISLGYATVTQPGAILAMLAVRDQNP